MIAAFPDSPPLSADARSENGHIDADQLAAQIDQGTTGISRVDGGIRLEPVRDVEPLTIRQHGVGTA